VAKKWKQDLLLSLEQLDKLVDCQVLGESLWDRRYKIEGELEQLYHKEEIHWQQRGGEKWLLMGDANTEYFHTCANGRRRKTRIVSLDSENGTLTRQKEISDHIVGFYKHLFGSPRINDMHLVSGFWLVEEQLGVADKACLDTPFPE
jgi:hypothetical protein